MQQVRVKFGVLMFADWSSREIKFGALLDHPELKGAWLATGWSFDVYFVS